MSSKNGKEETDPADSYRFTTVEALTYQCRPNSVRINYSDAMKGGGKKPTHDDVVKLFKQDFKLKEGDVINLISHSVGDHLVVGVASDKIAEELHGLLDAPGGCKWTAIGKHVTGHRTDLPMVNIIIKNVSPAVTRLMIEEELKYHFCKGSDDKVERLEPKYFTDFGRYYGGEWSARIRLADWSVLKPFIHREPVAGEGEFPGVNKELWHLFFPGQDDIVCYRCCQSGHSGRFCKRTQLYADKAAKAKGGPDPILKRKFDEQAKKHEAASTDMKNQLRDTNIRLGNFKKDLENMRVEKKKCDDEIASLKRELAVA